MYRSIISLHVLASLIFLISHGVSGVMAFRLRRAQNLDRVRSMLNVSSRLRPVMFGSLLMLLAAGIAGGFMANWWVMGWIWASLVLLILISAWMTYYTIRYYTPLRAALGISDARLVPSNRPPATSEEEIAALIRAANPWALLIPGLGTLVAIVWLMIAKPF